jgi:hypothetical protein
MTKGPPVERFKRKSEIAFQSAIASFRRLEAKCPLRRVSDPFDEIYFQQRHRDKEIGQ